MEKSAPDAGGAIEAGGVYTATAFGMEKVRVMDGAGNKTDVTVTVAGGIVIDPPEIATYPASLISLYFTGGIGALTPTIQNNLSGGQLEILNEVSAYYTPGAVAGVTDVIKVTDKAGNSATMKIEILKEEVQQEVIIQEEVQ